MHQRQRRQIERLPSINGAGQFIDLHGAIERWKQPKLTAWEVPKRNPHERRPRAPEWEPEAAAKIAEVAAASDNAAGDDIAA